MSYFKYFSHSVILEYVQFPLKQTAKSHNIYIYHDEIEPIDKQTNFELPQ